MPIVLDTNLNHLQLLLFDKIVSTVLPSQSQSSKEEILTIEKSEPTIPSFAVRPMPLDHSLTFSKSSKISKQQNKRERKVTRLQYTKKMTMRMITNEIFTCPSKLPFISLITRNTRRMQTLTLTVAPVLQSICHRERHGGEWGWHFVVLFDDCVDDTGDSEDGDGSSNRRRYNQVADCI